MWINSEYDGLSYERSYINSDDISYIIMRETPERNGYVAEAIMKNTGDRVFLCIFSTWNEKIDTHKLCVTCIEKMLNKINKDSIVRVPLSNTDIRRIVDEKDLIQGHGI